MVSAFIRRRMIVKGRRHGQTRGSMSVHRRRLLSRDPPPQHQDLGHGHATPSRIGGAPMTDMSAYPIVMLPVSLCSIVISLAKSTPVRAWRYCPLSRNPPPRCRRLGIWTTPLQIARASIQAR
jgi:hypothetical protein